MDKFLQISGIAGIVLIAFGLVAYLFTGNILDPYVLIHLAAAVLCLSAYLYSQGRSLVNVLRQRSTRYGAHSLVYTLLFAGILVMLNFLNARYHQRWDLTEAQVYRDRKSTRLNSSHLGISYAVFCLKKKSN